MKKLMAAVSAVLLVWNVWLTVELNNYRFTEDVEGNTVIQHTVNTYTAEVSEMIRTVQGSIVGIESIAVASTRNLSGIVYDKDDAGNLYIFTECTAVRFADEINVTFDNGLTVTGSLAGFDYATNLALVSCTPGFEVQPVKKGKSSAVSAGDYVVMLGAKNMRTMAATVSSGMSSSSSCRRVSSDSSWICEVLEADGHVVSENAGGGMFNVGGELMGMLVSSIADSGSGMNYAVAADEMALVYSELREEGAVQRGSLGITGRSIGELRAYEKNARNLSLDLDSGVLVTYVYSDSAAAEIIQKDDVITAVNGETVTGMLGLRSMLYKFSEEETVELTVLRNGAEQVESVVLK